MAGRGRPGGRGLTVESRPTFWAAPELAKAGYPVFPLDACCADLRPTAP